MRESIPSLSHVARQDQVLDADLTDLHAEVGRTLGHERSNLAVDGVARWTELLRPIGQLLTDAGEASQQKLRQGPRSLLKPTRHHRRGRQVLLIPLMIAQCGNLTSF